MKWCYVAFGVNREQFAGVVKKIEMQADAIGQISEGCDVLLVDRQSIDMKCGNEQKRKEYNDVFVILKNTLEKYDAFYFRWAGSDKYFNALLKIVRDKVVVVEIPTYPIVGEMHGKARGRFKKKDYLGALKSYVGGIVLQYFHLRRQKKWVDIFVLTSMNCTIKGVKTVNILNGINPKQIKPKKVHENSETLKLLAVANISYWHGFDRIIKGLAEYEGDKKVEFVIVGEGSELNELKRIVSCYSIDEKVSFRGLKFGEELDQCFEECNVAVGSLGLHRLGITPSSLKGREYMARGIPFIMTDTESMEKDSNIASYIYEIPGDDTPVNIGEIVNWVDKMDMQQASHELRKYAVEHCTWNSQMLKVMNAIQDILGK